MAIARIEVLSGLPLEQKLRRLDAVRRSLVSALRVPDDDPTVMITELEPDAIILPGGTTDQFTIVQITLFAGRSIETKRALYKGICSALVSVGVSLSDILIVLVDTPTENWGVQGGTPATEVDLGFQVDL